MSSCGSPCASACAHKLTVACISGKGESIGAKQHAVDGRGRRATRGKRQPIDGRRQIADNLRHTAGSIRRRLENMRKTAGRGRLAMMNVNK
ncbi:hypothetical protein [Paenibacillus curdlanolyticus]|uniref:hypothetical protein n=1 Tax=Paenibacillus curdlanolyticus TaxID=59840 RepID=UPI0002DD87A2|nr:hypothetical protein [Paenibacillus curdlanolyticus]